MIIVATDAIYIAEIDNATDLLDKTAADAAEADKATRLMIQQSAEVDEPTWLMG